MDTLENAFEKRSRKLKSYPIKKEETIWEYYQGKENTDEVLIEKAQYLAPLLVGGILGDVDSYIKSLQEKENIKIDYVTSGMLILEMFCLNIHLSYRAASDYLSTEKRNTFIKELYLESREILTKEMRIKDGPETPKFLALCDTIYIQRHEEYQKHEYENLSVEEKYGVKDTFYRAFGEKIADLFDLKVDLAMDNNIQSLFAVAAVSMGLTRRLFTTGSRESDNKEQDEEIDFSKRILCSDGNCIGLINDKGICNVCGMPGGKSSK